VIGLDTNVLMRFFMQDDPAQGRAATAFFRSLSNSQPGWVGLATILEAAWVMKSVQKMDRETIAATLGRLLALDSLLVEQADVLEEALRRYRRTRADFADCLIAASARAAGCRKTVTFDQIAARDAGMELLA
jgi:predicted nucleic-acid-binding protein